MAKTERQCRPSSNNGIAVVRIEDNRGGMEGYTGDILWNGGTGIPPGGSWDNGSANSAWPGNGANNQWPPPTGDNGPEAAK